MRPAALGERITDIAKPWAEDSDSGDYVSLADLLEDDERNRQYH
jgi:hypothetical protein